MFVVFNYLNINEHKIIINNISSINSFVISNLIKSDDMDNGNMNKNQALPLEYSKSKSKWLK